MAVDHNTPPGEEVRDAKLVFGQQPRFDVRLAADKNLLDLTLDRRAVFLDNDLRIKSFTPAMTDIFHLIDSALGRSIKHIAARIASQDLEQEVRRVIRTRSSIERETKNPQTGSQYARKQT